MSCRSSTDPLGRRRGVLRLEQDSSISIQGGQSMLFVGDDWAEDHHDVYLMNDTGERLASRRLPEGLAGIARLHELIAEHAKDPAQVVIGIETDRGLGVDALTAADYQVFAVNPLAAARYRDRHHVSGAKSDASDAKLLADLGRNARPNPPPRRRRGRARRGCCPGPKKFWAGPPPATPTVCAVRCASTTPRPWRRSRISPTVTRWPSWAAHRPPPTPDG